MAKKKITFENLAGMIKRGFDGNDKRFDKVDSRLDTLDNGVEEIKLKLDNVAYRFEVEELTRRIKRLELKLGIK